MHSRYYGTDEEETHNGKSPLNCAGKHISKGFFNHHKI
jgi:hypothetical protein